MLGLKRGTVRLETHREEWTAEACKTIEMLKGILGNAAADIQHVGSTAISGICAKPIIDIAVGMRDIWQIDRYLAALDACGVVDRGSDVPGQRLLVMGDFALDQRSHHIHVVAWNGQEWKNYICFRNYLNAFPEKAKAYERSKFVWQSNFRKTERHTRKGRK